MQLVHSSVDQKVGGTFGDWRSNAYSNAVSRHVIDEPRALASKTRIDLVQRVPQFVTYPTAAFALVVMHELAYPFSRDLSVLGLATPDLPPQAVDLPRWTPNIVVVDPPRQSGAHL
jgi:hypothetical protein